MMEAVATSVWLQAQVHCESQTGPSMYQRRTQSVDGNTLAMLLSDDDQVKQYFCTRYIGNNIGIHIIG